LVSGLTSALFFSLLSQKKRRPFLTSVQPAKPELPSMCPALKDAQAKCCKQANTEESPTAARRWSGGKEVYACMNQEEKRKKMDCPRKQSSTKKEEKKRVVEASLSIYFR
jgi:hypothetical protein